VKISTTKLRQIIKEEITAIYESGWYDDENETLADKKFRDSHESEKMPRANLRNRVHQYLIDKKFFKGRIINGQPMIEIFWGPPEGPDVPVGAGYTNSARKFLKLAVETGDIDWATWEEIEPIWQEIDRSID
jgi:hypothetical protein